MTAKHSAIENIYHLVGTTTELSSDFVIFMMNELEQAQPN